MAQTADLTEGKQKAPGYRGFCINDAVLITYCL